MKYFFHHLHVVLLIFKYPKLDGHREQNTMELFQLRDSYLLYALHGLLI